MGYEENEIELLEATMRINNNLTKYKGNVENLLTKNNHHSRQ